MVEKLSRRGLTHSCGQTNLSAPVRPFPAQFAGRPAECPQCQHDDRPGQTFGGECGVGLASLCGSCGAANPREQNCGECGRSLTSAPPSDKFAWVAAVRCSAGWRRGRDIAVWRIGGGHMRRVLGSFLLTAGVLTASSGEVELATQGCWKKLNGKAQVEWYGT